jgi:hypothetical protein
VAIVLVTMSVLWTLFTDVLVHRLAFLCAQGLPRTAIFCTDGLS